MTLCRLSENDISALHKAFGTVLGPGAPITDIYHYLAQIYFSWATLLKERLAYPCWKPGGQSS